MAGLMDWDAYRTEAGRQTAALNQTPYVLDPSRLTSDAAANNKILYGTDPTSTTPANLRKVIEKGFRDGYGRDAKPEDYNAWLAEALKNGQTPDALLTQIVASATSPEYLASIGKSPAGATFDMGAMAGGGTSPFATGMMGGDGGVLQVSPDMQQTLRNLGVRV